MRGHLETAQMNKELEEIVGATTDAYMTRIEKERKKKEKIISYYRSKEKEIEDAFFEFSTGTERELDDCRYYIQSLTDGESAASKVSFGYREATLTLLTSIALVLADWRWSNTDGQILPHYGRGPQKVEGDAAETGRGGARAARKAQGRNPETYRWGGRGKVSNEVSFT